MISTIIYWFRWVALLPTALLAGFLATFPLRWVLYSTLTSFIEPYPELPERLLTPFVTAAVFIWVGSKVAPAYKMEATIVLFALWIFLIGGTFFLVISGANLSGGQLFFQTGIFSPILAIAGALAGLYIARRKISEKETKDLDELERSFKELG